jgi:Xaa-Pro aminopeptidase
MKAHGGGNKRLAVDSLSHTGCDALRARGLMLVEGEQITETARAVKSNEELILMNASMDVCQAGIQSMHEFYNPITENALLQNSPKRTSAWRRVDRNAAC